MMQNGLEAGHHANAHQPNLDNIRTLMLTEAIKSGNLETVTQILSEHSVDINQGLDGLWPPFLLASFHCQFDIMVHFLNLGADPKRAPNFFTALMAASSSLTTEEEAVLRCVRFLINQGLPVNEKDSQRTTALMMAARNGHKEVVAELLSRGAIVDMQDYEGWSAIFHAVSQNHVEIVKMLIENGASIKLEDRRGRRLVDIAEVKGFVEIVNLLSKDKKQAEVVEIEPEVPINLSVRSYKDMVRELPGNNEFLADTLNFLHTLYLDRYERTFYNKKISFGDLLLMDNDDLKEAGVYLSQHRKLILSSTRKFHLSTWKNCFGVKKGSKLQSDELAFFLANITRQLYSLTQSTKYIKKNCDNDDNEVFKNEFETIISKSIDHLNFIEKRLEKIRDFGVKLDNYDRVEYVDLVNEETLRTKNRVLSKFFMVYFPSTILSLILLRYKNLVPVFFKLLVNKVAFPQWCKLW